MIGSGSPKQKAAAISMAGGAPRIAPGVVYAGGVEARVVAAPGIAASPFGYHEQADFPVPPPPPGAGTAYRLYADLWERPVVSLEDQELRDAGLHGADTCTRTQTMAQVKWCPVGKDPESAADNPGLGNALLTAAFPQGGGPASSDPCDPQAGEVDPVGGDFLFRLEVHDARWPANAAPNAPDRVVVKWSRENGAEQFLYPEMPDWFTTGEWRYELFDLDAEKHLGFHLAPAWMPKRGAFTATLPPTPPAGVTSVRRWDGYCVLVRTGGNWAVSGLAGETPSETAPGAQVEVANGKLAVRLTDLELTLELAGKVLLPGDYWSTAVRRASYQPGTELLKSTPMGVLHRYVALAEVQANGQLRARTAREQRKLAFPRLSELDDLRQRVLRRHARHGEEGARPGGRRATGRA